MKEELPKGYDCPACGRFHRFSPWVYAHWDIAITHSCNCGVEATILMGRAYPPDSDIEEIQEEEEQRKQAEQLVNAMTEGIEETS